MKGTVIAIVIAGALIGGAFMFSSGDPKDGGQSTAPSNLSVENGVQVIEIRAKGGYSPKKTVAVAGMPTVIRFNTKSTFDCSSALTIPSLGIQKNLPMNGTTDIPIGTSTAGSLFGSCSMGMYGFEVVFQD
jgi:plastocyanin domain-containing protein